MEKKKDYVKVFSSGFEGLGGKCPNSSKDRYMIKSNLASSLDSLTKISIIIDVTT